MIETGKIIDGNCVDVMKTLPEGSIDLIVTSPPYNANIKYDEYNDGLSMEEYWDFTINWLSEAFRVLKDDGRVAINVVLIILTMWSYQHEVVQLCNKSSL